MGKHEYDANRVCDECGMPSPRCPVCEVCETYAKADAKGRKNERAAIVKWLRSFILNENAQEFAAAIEAREDDKGPIVYGPGTCPARESGGVQCTLAAGHEGGHVAPPFVRRNAMPIKTNA